MHPTRHGVHDAGSYREHVASKQERARSFGAIAEDYDRLRPSPAPAALDWLVPADCKVAVDLAAGTGLLTRGLLAHGVPTVIAVEPDPQMRAVLSARTPEVETLDGTGEEMPLEDESVDGVFVSSAWHWFDEAKAVPEIARVLRDGGRLGVLWSSRDRELEWVRDLDRTPEDVPIDVAAENRHRWRREVSAANDSRFKNIARKSVPFTRRMKLEDAVAMVATYSRVITSGPDYQKAVLDNARAILHDQYGDAAEIDFPMRSWCWRGDRAPR
jgi:SAM-dependent methyltransferase